VIKITFRKLRRCLSYKYNDFGVLVNSVTTEAGGRLNGNRFTGLEREWGKYRITGNGNYPIDVAGGRYSVFVPFRVGS